MQPRQMIQRLMNNISTVIVGKQEVIEYALIALLCRGHVLIEDEPEEEKETSILLVAASESERGQTGVRALRGSDRI